MRPSRLARMMRTELAGVEVPAARTSASTSRGVSGRGSSYAAASRIAMSLPLQRTVVTGRPFLQPLHHLVRSVLDRENQRHPKILQSGAILAPSPARSSRRCPDQFGRQGQRTGASSRARSPSAPDHRGPRRARARGRRTVIRTCRQRAATGRDAMGGLTGRTVLITGAARGIGAATARRLAGDGARVVLADVDGAGVEKLAAELGQVAVRVDVTRARGHRAHGGRALPPLGPARRALQQRRRRPRPAPARGDARRSGTA